MKLRLHFFPFNFARFCVHGNEMKKGFCIFISFFYFHFSFGRKPLWLSEGSDIYQLIHGVVVGMSISEDHLCLYTVHGLGRGISKNIWNKSLYLFSFSVCSVFYCSSHSFSSFFIKYILKILVC